MKKCISFILVATLLFSCVACKKEKVTELSSETTTSSTTEITTTTEAPTPMGTGFLAGLKEESDNYFINEDPKYAELINVAKGKADMYGFDGVILLATDDEIILFYGTDGAITIENEPVDPYTTYDIASCSKTLTAVAVFQLIEQGKISLDDTLDKYFPEYETGKGITIYNLLHMQSGIPDYCNNPPAFFVKVSEDDLMPFFLRFMTSQMEDEEEVFLENLYAAPLDFEPGKQYAYSNTNYRLLAMIVEQVSGTKFCDYISENIFIPCGMEHSSCMVPGDETSVPKDFDDALELGLVDEGGRDLGKVWGDGGVHTGAADLLAFDRSLFGGELVSDTSLLEMINFDKKYGCGLQEYNKKGAFGHSGGIYSYISENIIIDSEELGRVYFILLSSCRSGSNSTAFGFIMDGVVDELT